MTILLLLALCPVLPQQTTMRESLAVHEWIGQVAQTWVGSTVGRVGDVDGDGLQDWGWTDGNAPQPSQPVGVRSGRSGELLLSFDPLAVGGYAPDFVTVVAAAGDVDGDGRDDVAFGAPLDSHLLPSGGSLWLLSGVDGSLLHLVHGGVPFGRLGSAIAALGDVDGDGRGDVAVGAPQDSTAGSFAGAVRVVSGADGAVLHALHGQAGDELGTAVCALGDVDGDGVVDFAAGAPGADTAHLDAGAVLVVSGASGAVVATIPGSPLGSGLGFALAGPGDLDGDLVPDVVAGAPWGGSLTGVVQAFSVASGALLWTHGPFAPLVPMGREVHALHDDLDGDGAPDVLIGTEARMGAPLVLRGSLRVLSGADGGVLLEHVGEPGAEQLGLRRRAGVLGDLNGDGYPDVVAGFPAVASSQGADLGAVRVLLLGAPVPVVYCTAKAGPGGCTPSIGWHGAPSLSLGPGVEVRAQPVSGGARGTLAWSREAAALPFHGGTLCLDLPEVLVGWIAAGGTPGACDGALVAQLTSADLHGLGLGAGEDLFLQLWYREPASTPPGAVGLSDALWVTVLP